MKKWRVIPANDEAAEEAALLFEDKGIKAECQSLLALLADEDNPGTPRNPKLNVEHIEHHAPGWYRLRVDSYKIRIAFSLTYFDGNRTREYQFRELPFGDVENYIRVQYIGYRTSTTYKDIGRRWRKTHRK